MIRRRVMLVIILTIVISGGYYMWRLGEGGRITERLGKEYIEVQGRARGFSSLADPPFFRFRVWIGLMRYEVRGFERHVFMNKTISPVFTDLTLDWRASPLVRVFGRVDGGDIAAFFVDVKFDGEWRNWYYKSFLRKDEQDSLVILSYYANRNASVWMNGTLTKDDLLRSLPNWEDVITQQYFGEEAYVNGVIRAAWGVWLEVNEAYVKQADAYIKVYPPD